MISVKNNQITMTRSDSLIVHVIMEKDGELYTPNENDYIRFAMSTKYKDENKYSLLIDKEIPNDTLILELTPADTQNLSYGTYNYDIEITYADGRVDTFISSELTLSKEVK